MNILKKLLWGVVLTVIFSNIAFAQLTPTRNPWSRTGSALQARPTGLDLDMNGADYLEGGVIYLIEQAEANGDIEASGQIWVNTATPNELWFTDDAGTDFQLGVTGGAPTNATYITQTANGSLSNEQAMGALATGIVKNATTTGIQSIAAEGTDYYAPAGTDVTQADGGTGIDSSGVTDGQLLVGTTAGNTWSLAGLTGTANQITVTDAAASITLSTPQDIATGSSVTFDDVTVSDDLKALTTINTPDVDQSITAAGDTISSSASHVHINPDADYIMTSTPTITAGVNGQILFLQNISAFTVDVQDDADLGGSDIFVNGASSTVKPGSVMTLIYSDTNPGWHIVSNPNTAAAGANADTIPVRNVSGSGLTAGKAVYATGYNVGLNRITVDLADADDPTKMPAIGFTAATIGNGANGDVVTSGTLTGSINTAAAAVNDGVWVGTTAGDVVFTKPTSDAIQRIGIVTRSNATGNVLVQGAGRSNDIPFDLTVQNGGALRTDTTAADTLLFQAYDNDSGPAYVTFATLTAGNTPTFDLSASTTIGSNAIIDASDNASASDINTGTDTTKFATADALAGSNHGVKPAGIVMFESDAAVTTGDGTVGLPIYAAMNGMNVIDVLCTVDDKGITGTTDVQARRRRAGSEVDILSTKVTIGDEWFANDGVVNTSNDDLNTGDILYIDVDAIHSGTAPNGLGCVVSAQLP